MTAANAKTQGYRKIYQGNSISVGESNEIVGQEVINAVLEKNGTSIGKASIGVKQLTQNGNPYNAQIKIKTRDFMQIGTITLNGGVLTWGELRDNAGEDNNSGISVAFNNAPNVIQINEENTLTIIATDENEEVITPTSTSYSSSNTGVATIDQESGTLQGVSTGTTTIQVEVSDGTNTAKANYTLEVIEPVVGQYVYYDLSYMDMYVEDTNPETEEKDGFTASNGWRILSLGRAETLNGEKVYYGTKLISAGIPAKLYYSYDTAINGNNTWWDIRDTNANIKTKVANGLKNARIPTNGVDRGFETIIFQPKTFSNTSFSANKGTYIKIGNNSENDVTGAVFKTSQAESVASVTLSDIKKALKILGSDADLDRSVGREDLFYLGKLKEYNPTNSSSASSKTYWVADEYNYNDKTIYYAQSNGYYANSNSTWSKLGIRPVVTLSQDVYIKYDSTDKIWKIYSKN